MSTLPEPAVPDAVPNRELLEECVRAATLAPSIYNSQPWWFRLGPGCIDVFADPTRMLPAIDPDGREMHISLGAALLNIDVMLVAQGLCPRITLLPEPAETQLVARIETDGAIRPTLHDLVLVAALTRRRTTREPFVDRPLHQATTDVLTEAAQLEGATLEVLDDIDARAVLALVRTADHELRADPSYRTELATWTTDYPGRRDGVLPESFGPRSLNAALPLRDFGAYQPWLERESQEYEQAPTIAVLTTPGDDRVDRLRAGLALQRVLLEGTVAGVSASFFTQPLQVPHLRRLYDERRPHTATQMIFRLGYARPGAASSPRRPVADVLFDC